MGRLYTSAKAEWRKTAFQDMLVAMSHDGADLLLNCSRRGFLGVVAAAPFAQSSFAQTTSPGEIVCRVIDRDTGRPVPARVRLVDEHSNEVVPLGHEPALAEDAQEGDVRFQDAATPMLTASSGSTRGGCLCNTRS